MLKNPTRDSTVELINIQLKTNTVRSTRIKMFVSLSEVFSSLIDAERQWPRIITDHIVKNQTKKKLEQHTHTYRRINNNDTGGKKRNKNCSHSEENKIDQLNK